jgi:NAD(P)-dependent dehydrogenase (short-subunit alcohol dehydrogenase family)
MSDRKVALVTGASRGIGAAIAQRFAREGAHVVGVSRTGSEPDGDVEFLCADVARPEDVERTVADVVRRYGRLDVLVNNAAVVGDENRPLSRPIRAHEVPTGRRPQRPRSTERKRRWGRVSDNVDDMCGEEYGRLAARKRSTASSDSKTSKM